MAALEPRTMAILKERLAVRCAASLAPILGKINSADQAAKQRSRALSAFNANVQNRKAGTASALDSCSHIKRVVPDTPDGVSQTDSSALQALLSAQAPPRLSVEPRVTTLRAPL